MTDVVIIGAGPYGLSIAAHLKARGIDFRIFGSTMDTWLTSMPRGMRLKSEGFASSLYDPEAALTLGKYCKETGLPYQDIGLPVPLETFTSYGLEFQRRLVPEVENKAVVSVHRSSVGFDVTLDNGEVVRAKKVVAAVGLTHFGYVPPILANLPEEFATHSSRHSTVDRFKGQEVIVVGGGASALDLAALLHQAGASVHVVARKTSIRFHDPPGPLPPSLHERLRYPTTGIGPGWKLVFVTRAPHIFRHLPQQYRLDAVKRILGPAPGWFVKEQVAGKMPFTLGATLTEANIKDGKAALHLVDQSGEKKIVRADHVIAATGYKVDLRRLTFLNSSISSSIGSVENTPVLSANFESSVPGLYFVGASAANTFGPLLRFAYGAGFAAKRLAKHFVGSGLANGNRRTN
jgi:thioredoxin reductase